MIVILLYLIVFVSLNEVRDYDSPIKARLCPLLFIRVIESQRAQQNTIIANVFSFPGDR